ncbi:ABC transporter ATP-binding protein [Bosea sp. NBC_00550]|uniref:ABC transporter ATP-binding protein n=1 Tax=Bosea sp. NBC_00550 TaxID=2969621 RepID=UPI0022311131|nr:ABC transporter ATP-binding protein [Bosea sp. NBC_00550]UZF91782.1 ABC transporter ATP-binding protein/permease [Bosea sp. NBC_00550]
MVFIAPLASARTTLLQRFTTLARLPRLLRSLWTASPVLVSAAIVLRLLRAVQPPLVLFVGKLIVDEVVLQAGMPSPGPALADWLASGRLSALAEWLALECVLMVGANILQRLSTLTEGLLSERHANRLGIDLIEHAARLDLMDIESSQAQDKLLRARIQTMSGGGLLSLMMGQVQSVVTLIAFLAGLIFYAPVLVCLLMLALLPTLLSEAYFNEKTYDWSVATTPERRQMEYVRHVGSVADLAKEVKLFGLGGFLADRFGALAERLFVARRRLAISRAVWGSLFGAVGSLAYYAAYAVLAWRAVRSEISLGDLIFLSGSLLRLNGLFEGLILGLTQIASQAQYLNDYFSFMDLRSSMPNAARPRAFPSPLRQGIVFEDVGFRYPGKDGWAVRHLSFVLSPGETLALVGENGAGKTTIVKLLTRLYDPVEGRILVDGIDLREIDLDELRSHVGAIFQDFARYNITAAENIGIGRVAAIDDRPRIVEAARKSLADPLMGKLPMGYDQMLGRSFAQGIDLSGGEWQKIAIARAYFRDADILILDEPTAALDARAEVEIFERFRNLSRSTTALLISHRFSTVRMADRIIVLENGAILESGDHAALMALGGRYAELFSLQAAGFQ